MAKQTKAQSSRDIAIGGDVSGSVIVTGDHNIIVHRPPESDGPATQQPTAGGLENSLVRIYDTREQIVGAGFLVGRRHILTCWHVVEHARGENDTITLDFPFLHSGRLTASLQGRDEEQDAAVLLLEETPPERAYPVRSVVIEHLWGHPFRAFGFPEGHPDGVWATGIIRGPNARGWLQIEDVKTTGYFVQPGFSGSPVWDDEVNGVVGMVVAAEREAGVRAAFCIPASLLREGWPDLDKQPVGGVHVLQPAHPTAGAGGLPSCPFVAGGMITDPRLFVGRKAELRTLTSRMQGAQPISVNVVGERRIGKSSLLYHLFLTWEQRVRDPNRYVVIYLSLQDARAQNETAFYDAIANALLARPAVRLRPALVEVLQRRPMTRADFAAAIDAFHENGLLPVLFLDEFEALFRHPEQFTNDFFDAMRALMDRNAMMLILASLRPLDIYRRQHRLTSSFFNLGHTLPLGSLTEEEAADLIRLPASTVPGAPAALRLEEQRLARQWGGRHPYLLQLAASCLCQARQEGRDVAWARRCFEQQAVRLPSPPRLSNFRHLFRLLAWQLPATLGRLAGRLGGAVDEARNWLVGIIIILVFLLALAGFLGREQLIDLLRRILGG